MHDQTLAPAEPDPADDKPQAPARLPLPIRLLGTVGIAALIVALYAVVQFVSSDDDPSLDFDVGQGQEIRQLGTGEPPAPGTVAPDFAVATLDGGRFSLSEHLATDGRPVFLNMWAEWCFPCRREMPAIEATFKARPEVHFIGMVIRDREAPVRGFIEEFDITYQIGLDGNGQVEEDYFVWVMPTTYLIGSDGIIVRRIFGPLDESDLDELVDELLAAGN